MSFKTTYVLFGILGVMLVIFNLAIWMAPTAPVDESYVFPSAQEASAKVDSNDITKVTLRHRKPKKPLMVFSRKKGEKWMMEEPGTYRVNDVEVNTLVDQVLNVRRQTADLPSNLKEFELDDPAITVTLEGKDRTFELNIGAQTETLVYALSNEHSDEPLVILRRNLSSIYKNVDDFRSRDLLASSMGEIEHIEIKKTGEGAKTSILDSDKGKWTIVEPKLGPADYEGSGKDPNAPTGVRDLQQALVGLQVAPKEGFVADNVPDAKLKSEYDLAASSAPYLLTVKLDGKKESRTLLVGKVVPGTEGDKEMRYARLQDSRSVVKVPAAPLKTLQAFLNNPEPIRDHSLLRLPKDPDVIRVKYLASGTTMDLMKTGTKAGIHGTTSQWQMYLGDKAQPTDEEQVRTLIEELQGKRVILRFLGSGEKAPEVKDKVLEVSFWTEGIEKKADATKKDPEKKPEIKGKPDVTLIFGKEDVDGISRVRREMTGEAPLAATVRATILERAKEQPLTYLARRMPPFTTPGFADVTGVTIDQGKTTTQVVKEKKGDQEVWTIKKPEALKDRKATTTAVQGILATFQNIQVVQWVTLKPTKEELQKYGLASPTIRVAISLKDKKEPVEFLVGSQSPNKGRYYARKDDGAVFEINDLVLTEVKKPLQDMSVLNFNLGDLKTMVLTGWKDVIGQPVTRKLSREGNGDWKMVDPSALSVTQSKIDDLAIALASLSAKEFVLYKTGAKPEHGLDVNANGLKIDLTFKDGKTISITIGKKAGEDTYYAMTDQLPGDVFTVSKTPFEKVMEKPSYISLK